MLTIANKGRYVVKKYQKYVYVFCEGSISWASSLHTFSKGIPEKESQIRYVSSLSEVKGK